MAFLTPVRADTPTTAGADLEACFQTDPEIAIAGCTRVIERPDAPTTYRSTAFFTRGDAYFLKQDFARALADYDEAMKLSPEFYGLYSRRGDVYLFQKDYDRAITDYDETIRLKPDYGYAFTRRGDAFSGKTEYDRAIADYEQALRLDPSDAEAAEGLRTAQTRGDVARAEPASEPPPATMPASDRRVALVIGNQAYTHLNPLKKAVADAESYAALLRAKGFATVILKTDLTRAGMDEAIAGFVEQIDPGDTAVFAYAGHGWSDGAQNFLVGTDAPAAGSQEYLARISIPLKNGLDGVIDDMDRRGAALKVAIVDACRDNPFRPPAGTRSVGLTRGLARVDPPKGTFVIFSAASGQTALDRLAENDPDPNSVFTRVLVPILATDVSLLEAVKTAQQRVDTLARSIDQVQNPAYYDEVVGQACLTDACN